MSSRKLFSRSRDERRDDDVTDRAEAVSDLPVSDLPAATGADDALALAEQAEAEAAEADAVAAAARARARAAQLRRQAAQSAVANPPDTDESPDDTAPATDEEDATGGAETADLAATDDASDPPAEQPPTPVRDRRRWWLPAGIAAAMVAIVALLGVSGYMLFEHRQAEQDRQRTAEAAAAARQGVVTLMSLDFNNAEEDVQRIVDNSTGDFREEFAAQQDDFIAVAQEAKVVTDATVSATAVKSVTDDEAVVLVAARSVVTNAAGAEEDPRSWRLILDLKRDGGPFKMSKVEFVP